MDLHIVECDHRRHARFVEHRVDLRIESWSGRVTDNMQHATDTVQRATDDMQHATDNMQHATDDTQRTICNVRRAPDTAPDDMQQTTAPTLRTYLVRSALPTTTICAPMQPQACRDTHGTRVIDSSRSGDCVGWGLKGLRQGAYQRDGLRGVDAVLHERAARARLDDLLDHRRADAEPDVARRYTRLREVEEVVVIHACSTAAGGGSSHALVQHAGGRCVCTRGLGYQAASEACRAASRCRRCKGSSGRMDGQGCRPCCTLHTLQR